MSPRSFLLLLAFTTTAHAQTLTAEQTTATATSEAPRPIAPASSTIPTPQEFEKTVAAEGLIITRLDAKGQPATEETGPIGKTTISFRDKPIFERQDMYVSFEPPIYRLGNVQLFLISVSSGGNACGANYHLIRLENKNATVTEEFGNCNPPEISLQPDHIRFSFFENYGTRMVQSYYNGRLIESKYSLPLHIQPDNNGKDFSHLASLSNNEDVEAIFTDSSLAPALEKLLGKDLPVLKTRLSVMEKPTKQEGWLIMEGAMPHAFSLEEGFLAISLTSNTIYAAIFTTNQNDPSLPKSIRAYTNAADAKDGAGAPEIMKSWITRHEEAKASWNMPH